MMVFRHSSNLAIQRYASSAPMRTVMLVRSTCSTSIIFWQLHEAHSVCYMYYTPCHTLLQRLNTLSPARPIVQPSVPVPTPQQELAAMAKLKGKRTQVVSRACLSACTC